MWDLPKMQGWGADLLSCKSYMAYMNPSNYRHLSNLPSQRTNWPIGYILKWVRVLLKIIHFHVTCPLKNHPAGYPPAHLRGQVVISFPTLWGSGISWWRTDGAPIEWSLPFPSDVQWRRLVVEVSEAELLKGALTVTAVGESMQNAVSSWEHVNYKHIYIILYI